MMNGSSMEKESRMASRYLLLDTLPAIGIMTASNFSITEEFILSLHPF